MNPGAISKKIDELLRLAKNCSQSNPTTKPEVIQNESWRHLSIASTIQLIVGFLLAFTLFVSMKSYNVSKESLEQTQRAFLNPTAPIVEPTTLPTPAGRQQFLRVHAQWENTGTTPAPVVISYVHYSKIPDSDFNSWKFETPPEEHFHKMFAGPHTPLSFQSTMIPLADVMNQSNDHKTVWGWMTYKDVLPHTAPHVTEFCYFISEVAEKGDSAKPDQDGGASHHIQLTWTLCDRHNCVDTSCDDYDLVTAPFK